MQLYQTGRWLNIAFPFIIFLLLPCQHHALNIKPGEEKVSLISSRSVLEQHANANADSEKSTSTVEADQRLRTLIESAIESKQEQGMWRPEINNWGIFYYSQPNNGAQAHYTFKLHFSCCNTID